MLADSRSSSSARQEWTRYWPIVVSALVGMSLGTLASATLGLFMEPLQKAFGWSRAEISASMTVYAVVSLPLAPFAGFLVDRFGPRRIALPGVALCALNLAAFSLLNGSLAQWFLLWTTYTLASLLIRTMVWTSAVSKVFIVSRGLAIAVMLCSVALAQSGGPPLVRWLIDEFGWRGAYIGLGFGWGGTSLFLCLLFFDRIRPAPNSPNQTGQMQPAKPGGLTVGEAARSWIMYRIGFAIFVMAVVGAGLSIHLVPMLTGRGFSRIEAANIAVVMGVASAVGKLASGFLIDRFKGSLIPVLAFGGPSVCHFILLQSINAVWVTYASLAFLGYCGGAALQVAIYLTTRYAGLRSFGTIFGFYSSVMSLATGLGPLVAGAIYDAHGNYTLLFLIGAPLSLLGGLAVFRLGPYPDFSSTPLKRENHAGIKPI